jgi:AraC-like DNA-binding protein
LLIRWEDQTSCAMQMFKIPQALASGLKAAGIDPAALLRQSGLPFNFWTSGKGLITTKQLFKLWHTIGEMSNDPGIGLKIPGWIPLEQYHPANVAAQHARTFRDGLQRFARYKILCCREEMRITENKGEVRIELEWLLADEPPPALLLDAAFASALELGRRGTRRQLHPLRVELRRNPDHREIFERLYGCPVKFNAHQNALVFKKRDLDLPFVTYNAELLAMLSPQIDREVAKEKEKRTPSTQVKWVLKHLLGSPRSDIEEVAKELGMSSRTLQRRIADEGTSFRRLLSDARRELARHYLMEPSLELGETAYLLGYEDPNSFFRAFRLWEGTSPGEWRATKKRTRNA